MKNVKHIVTCFIAASFVSGCAGLVGELDSGETDKTKDRGRDSKDLSQLVPGIWIDPNGCDHWIIDDGVEGYLSTRYDPATGLPSCTGHGAETLVYGPFKSGSASVNGSTESTTDTTGNTGAGN